MFENGSGDVLATRREMDLAVCVNKLVPPASNATDHGQCRAGMAEDLDREQGAADGADHGMHCVPGGIHPGNFVGEKFEEIENAGDGDDDRVAQHFERLIRRVRGRSNAD